MSGHHSSIEEPQKTTTTKRSDKGNPTTPLKRISTSSSSIETKSSPLGRNRDSNGTNEGPIEKSEKLEGPKLSTDKILGSAEFSKTIAAWFGEKGFTAMRSFFRASVLNSLQKTPVCLNQANCTDMDATIVTLIADYLLKKGKYFTMSVFSNEVLRPLVKTNPNLEPVLSLIRKGDNPGEPNLTADTVFFVLRSLNLPPHSMMGTEVLHKYLEGPPGDLLSMLLSLLRDNALNLAVKEPAVRDDDVVAAFTEGLQEEMVKLQDWFSSFNLQFVDVSSKLIKMVSIKNDGGGCNAYLSGKEERELWNQLMKMDEHLKKEQEYLRILRDKEKKKLATYAKELESLHEEMNKKLKAIQNYEKSLKLREKSLKDDEMMRAALAVDYNEGGGTAVIEQKIDQNTSKTCRGLCPRSWIDTTTSGRIMEENLELRALLREQNLRIEALTKKAALLSTRCCREETTPSPSLQSDSYRGKWLTSRERSGEFLPPRVVYHRASSGALFSYLSSALRRAKTEIDCLRSDQHATDLQYERLLNNKLSKRLSPYFILICLNEKMEGELEKLQ